MERGNYTSRLIELNADIGEGGPDSELIPLVERVSIACGGHAGDETSMRQALRQAKEAGVKTGAHPGYPDQTHFGRKPIYAGAGDIARWVSSQIRALKQIADELGVTLFHVKPHGALYNLAATDHFVAGELINAMKQFESLALVVLAGSPLARWARAAGLNVLEEAFADRRYLSDGRLAPRSQIGAVIEHPEDAANQARAIGLGQPVKTLDGKILRITAQTLCLHSDGPGALERAKAVASAIRAECSPTAGAGKKRP